MGEDIHLRQFVKDKEWENDEFFASYYYEEAQYWGQMVYRTLENLGIPFTKNRFVKAIDWIDDDILEKMFDFKKINDYGIEFNREVGYLQNMYFMHNFLNKQLNFEAYRYDCGHHAIISKEKLKELINILKTVNENNCKEILPNITDNEEFMHCTGYGEGYFWRLNMAIKVFEKVLNSFDFENYTLECEVSWMYEEELFE